MQLGFDFFFKLGDYSFYAQVVIQVLSKNSS